MSVKPRPIAVVGASPFAWLLAGILAADHSRAVVLASPAPDPNRLWPAPTLSAAPLTRPATWALLRAHAHEAVRRLSRIAPGIATRGDIRFAARSPEGVMALGHMRRTLDGLGYPVEPLPAPEGVTALGLRDAWHLETAALVAVLPAWLRSLGVTLAGPDAAGTIEDVVLADDEAILSLLAQDEIAAFARVTRHIGIRTAPERPLGHRAALDLDTGAALAQSPSGALAGIAPDGDGLGLNRLAACLPQGLAPRLAARTLFEKLVPHDGAPVVGPVRRGKARVVAGLGSLDLVLAPLIAGFLAGEESAWLSAHGPGQPRAAIADYTPGAGA